MSDDVTAEAARLAVIGELLWDPINQIGTTLISIPPEMITEYVSYAQGLIDRSYEVEHGEDDWLSPSAVDKLAALNAQVELLRAVKKVQSAQQENMTALGRWEEVEHVVVARRDQFRRNVQVATQQGYLRALRLKRESEQQEGGDHADNS